MNGVNKEAMTANLSRYLIGVGLLAVLFLGVTAYEVWNWSYEQVRQLSQHEAQMLLDFNDSVWRYADKEIIPFADKWVKNDDFLPEVMSAPFISRRILDELQKRNPGYRVKFSDENPRNPENLASPGEVKLLGLFKENPEIKSASGEMILDGEKVFYEARPRKVEMRCIQCHGRPEDAPPMLVAKFGSVKGFGKSPGDIWLDFVGISEENIRAAAFQTAKGRLEVVGVTLAMFLASLSAFGFFYIRQQRSVETRMRESRDFLQALIDSIPDPIVVTDRNYQVIHASKSQKQNSGEPVPLPGINCYKRTPNLETQDSRALQDQASPSLGLSEIPGTPRLSKTVSGNVEGSAICQIAVEPEKPCCEKADNCLLDLVLQSRKPVVVEHTRKLPDNRTQYLEVTSAPVFDDKNEIVQFVTFFHDITKRREAEKTARQGQKDWKDCFNAIQDMITIHDADFNVIQANHAAVVVLKVPLYKNDVKKCHELFHGMSSPPEWCVSCQALKTGLPAEFETYQPFLGKHLNIQAFPRFNESGKIIGLIHIARDITSRVHLAEGKSKLEAQFLQTQKLESLGVLTGGIAHDFNNIFASIQGFADLAMLDVDPGSPPSSELNQILAAIERANKLCKQLLSYSGRGHLLTAELSLRGVIEEVVAMLNDSIARKAVLKFEFGADLPPIDGDRQQLMQALINLLINATEAFGEKRGTIAIRTGVRDCSPEWLSGTIHYQAFKGGRCAYFEVIDDGCGMTKEVLARALDPFYSTKGPGRGLGLPASMGIIQAHHGGMKIDSEPGIGTTIMVFFPIRIQPPQGSPPEDRGLGNWRGTGTILVADDEETLRIIAQQILEKLGFQTILAVDGKKALEIFRARKNEIRCVILDFFMPNMDGEETIREMQKLKSDVKVILTSGQLRQEIPMNSASLENAIFLQKPFSVKSLATSLRAALEGKASDKG